MIRFDKTKTIELVVGIIAVYGIYFKTGLLQESVLKLSYKNDDTGEMQTFDYPQAQLIFVTSITWLVGFVYNITQYSSKERSCIPWFNGFKCGSAVTLSTIAYSYAIYFTNFPLVMMIRSCGILSVVLVGVLFTGVEDTTLKLGRRKILIAMIATAGIIIFKVFDLNKSDSHKTTQTIGIVLMVLCLLAEGFLPDFQAVVKSKHKPAATVLMVEVNKWAFILSFLYSIVTGHLYPMTIFLMDHFQLLIDVILIGVLSALGQLVIYRLVKIFKQHIVPFIITTRKIFTVGLSIIYYEHDIALIQMVGLVIVFGISIYEFFSEIKEDGLTQSDKNIEQPEYEKNQ